MVSRKSFSLYFLLSASRWLHNLTFFFPPLRTMVFFPSIYTVNWIQLIADVSTWSFLKTCRSVSKLPGSFPSSSPLFLHFEMSRDHAIGIIYLSLSRGTRQLYLTFFFFFFFYHRFRGDFFFQSINSRLTNSQISGFILTSFFFF